MRIVITGNMGYVGPVVVQSLRRAQPHATLVGLDAAYFSSCTLPEGDIPERFVDEQIFADVRTVNPSVLAGVDALVHLAGISNDPIGNAYQQVTLAVNHAATVELARQAKHAGVKSFVFASSCSVYGCSEAGPRDEDSAVDPLTAYAKSKVLAEESLKELASESFAVTCLRFSTACGPSSRLRLDLVLNDFVATALRTGKIRILSDGTPWRPLIDVRDMARAIEWAIQRDSAVGGPHLVINVGSDASNYQVRELAEQVAIHVPGASVELNPHGKPDKRSYRVNFARFRELAPCHQPQVSLAGSIRSIKDELEKSFPRAEGTSDFSRFQRLPVLAGLIQRGMLDAELRWVP